MYQQNEKGGQALYSGFFGQSSFSRHAVVSMSSLVKVPTSTDLALFAPLGCGLQTGAGAILNTLDVQNGSSVAVFGAGSVGMSAIMAAKLRKSVIIIAIDLQQSRLDLASQVGATHTLLGNDPGLVSKIRQLAPPNGVKYAVDCSGVPAVVETMIECLGSRGHATSVGAPSVSFSLYYLKSQHHLCLTIIYSPARKRESIFLPILSMAGVIRGAVRAIPCQAK